MLLAIGPQLVGINPNEGAVLQDGDLRRVAPSDLTFRFNEGQAIDPASLSGIRMTQSGLDGRFGDNNDIVITPGFVGIGRLPNEVVYRFAQPLADDVYRIEVFGSGATPLRNTSGQVFNDGQDFELDFELDLGCADRGRGSSAGVTQWQ